MKKLVILGAGGFAREVAWLVEEINKENETWNLLGFIDENENNHSKIINGYKVLGDFDWFNDKKEIYCVCAVGNTKSKKNMIGKAIKKGIRFAILIHPKVRKSSHVEIEEGTIICASNIITTNIKIGKHVILNLDCTVGHDAIIEDYVTILPGVNVSGTVIIQEGCNIGTGCAIINDTKIGAWTTVGAGAVVVNDLPSNCTAVGVPAKPIKYHEKI